jgi:SNF2 family DNA or RNA helicase
MSASMNPRIGMLARIRNRFGLIKSVTPNDSRSAEGIFHSVNIDYFDSETPSEETVIWERETNLHLSEPKSFPKVTDTNPMPLDLFRSLMHACQWSAMAPMLSKDQRPFISEKQPICSPVYGSIQVEDFQLYPVAKAMASSRVAMLIADDTGLGKTIEAGLLLTELIVKRRIRRVLVLCPPNLSEQWQDELSSKFGLNFDVIDLKSTTQHQKQHGLDANPWKGFDKIVTSFYYLKQPNVLEQFRAAAETSMASGKLPWDLLIVDEAHNLAPAPVGEPSDLYKMLKSVAPYFEHKVFLSATPHNGRTSSFSGLMEVLDPVKFMRKHELNATDKQNVSKATVRRLKSDINKICTPQRFANRSIATLINYPELNLKFDRAELDLFIAFQEFKEKIKLNIQKLDKTEKTTSLFAIQILQKRLLSCPYTFAFSWFKFLNGLKLKEEVGFNEVNASKKSYEKALNIENDDDNETEIKGANFVETTGAWLRNLNDKLGNDVQAVTDSLKKLGLVGGPDEQPIHDARYISLFNLIKKALISKETWLNDERIIVFTEYKTTLDYLERRLSKDFGNEVIATLYGQKPEVEKKKVYKDFNDPSSKIKILLATDAASEGLNLQESCRYVFHFDIPWNPIRLEQRNGRVDRHGQARDVTIFHFHSTDKDELSFLSKVFEKVDQIRNDLGSVADLFSGAISKFLVDNEK